jgi:hypothetical protein
MLNVVNYITKLWRRCSFGLAMRLGLFALFFFTSFGVFAQEKSLDGIVFDKNSKERIAQVNLLNTATGKSVYNNLKAEFVINAHIGDKLIFTKLNYKPDTITVQNYTSLAVYIQPLSIQLKEVTIHDSLATPEQRLLATKRDYPNIYGSIANTDLLSIGADGAGVGLSIDGLYNMFSRSGRNAAHLRENIQEDYYQNVIDYRFNKTLVGHITGLKDAQLADFMQKYRPGYYTVTTATDYEFISYIKANLRRYLRRPRLYTLPPLVK